jgi:hypothetical protein
MYDRIDGKVCARCRYFSIPSIQGKVDFFVCCVLDKRFDLKICSVMGCDQFKED